MLLHNTSLWFGLGWHCGKSLATTLGLLCSSKLKLRLSKRLNKLLLPKVASPSVTQRQNHAVCQLLLSHPSHLVPLQPSQQCQPSPNHKLVLCSSNSANPYLSQFHPTLHSPSLQLLPKPISQSQISSQFSTCCQSSPSQHLGQLLVACLCSSHSFVPMYV